MVMNINNNGNEHKLYGLIFSTTFSLKYSSF
jgi:hypothetical protein